jgi:threonine/homoserine/homoserine lactone efflux protein
MEINTWLLFSGIAVITVISPGPAVLLSVTNSLSHGLTKSIMSCLGNIMGIFIVSVAAILGLGAAMKASGLLFAAVKVFGAIYLIYLGLCLLSSKNNIFEIELEKNKNDRAGHMLFLQGLFTALSNPKLILFFTALFPQFLDPSKPMVYQFIILTITFMMYSFVILGAYAICAQTAKNWITGHYAPTWLNRISGACFVAFGLGILRLENKGP